MDVIKRTQTRAGLHSEAEMTVLRELSNKIHKEGIKVVNDRPDFLIQAVHEIVERVCGSNLGDTSASTNTLLISEFPNCGQPGG